MNYPVNVPLIKLVQSIPYMYIPIFHQTNWQHSFFEHVGILTDWRNMHEGIVYTHKPTFMIIHACMHIYLHLHESLLIKALNH